MVSGRWSPDGRQVVTASEEGAVRVWETPGTIGADPNQLADLAEAVSGLGSAGGKSLTPLSWARFSEIRDRILKETSRSVGPTSRSAADDSFGRLVRWLFADRTARTISPFSKVTVAEHLESLIRQDVVPALREAVELAPANPAIRARLAELEAKSPAEPGRVLR